MLVGRQTGYTTRDSPENTETEFMQFGLNHILSVTPHEIRQRILKHQYGRHIITRHSAGYTTRDSPENTETAGEKK